MVVCRFRGSLVACAVFLVPWIAFAFLLHVACVRAVDPLTVWAAAFMMAGLLWPAPMMIVIFIKRQRRLRSIEDGDVTDPLVHLQIIQGFLEPPDS